MNIENNKLLIINYNFPPYPGIGGRRWAKFSKFLSRKGKEVHVVCATSPFKNASTYLNDVNLKEIKVHQLPYNYYKYLLVTPETILEKLISKIQYQIARKKTKGNFFDKSILWEKYFNNEIPSIIQKEKINKVIISGAPFSYFVFALNMAKKLKTIELIIDYRDPWSDFNIGYDNPEVGVGPRYEFELNQEKYVLRNASKIFCVSEFQKKLLQEKVLEKKLDINVLPNGYDKEDVLVDSIKDDDINVKKYITISHVGTLNYEKSIYYKALLNAFKILKEKNYNIFQQLKLEFAGPVADDLLSLIFKYNLKDDVKCYGVLSHKEAINKIKNADIVLWFKFDQSPGDFATKFYEYVYFKKFLWVFSLEGEVTEFVRKNKIGKVFIKECEDELTNKIYKELINLPSLQYKFNIEFDTTSYDIENITDKLINEIWNK